MNKVSSFIGSGKPYLISILFILLIGSFLASPGTVSAAYSWSRYSLAVTTSGQGSVSKSPNQASYAPWSRVQLTATPASGWVFSGWSGALTGSANPATLTVNGNKAVTATFTQKQYTLTIQSPDGSGATSPASGIYTYSLGSQVQVAATPASGWQLDHWIFDGNNVGSTNPLTVTMIKSHTLSIVFKESSSRQILHWATVMAYGDTQARLHVNQFNAIAGKALYGYDTWTGQYPGGWGTDWSYLLGSGTQGLLPLFQDGTLKALDLVWMPFVSSTSDQQTQRDIIAGTWDSYIRTIAGECKAFGYPIYIRLGNEMNIYQQAGQWAHNPTDFVNCWRHVVDVFRAQGVTNVQWVWCANWADDPDGTINFRSYYPGDGYVDWVGIDMYQWNSGTSAWMADPEYELNGLHGDSIYDEYASRKPIAICEYGTNAYLWEGTDTSDAKRAEWLEKFFNAVEARPQIKWIGYYYATNYHWAFDSSTPLTLKVYQRRIANPIYASIT